MRLRIGLAAAACSTWRAPRQDRGGACPRPKVNAWTKTCHSALLHLPGEGPRPGTGQAVLTRADPERERMNEPRINMPEWTVTELSAALKRTVEDAYGYVRVRGEISASVEPHSSGHVYFDLKDERRRIAR